MKMRSLSMLAAALVAAFALAVPALATSSTPTQTETAAEANDLVGVRGYITEKKDRTILVESRPCRRDGEMIKYTRCDPSRWRGEKGYFAVSERTIILDKSGEPTLPARFRDLKVGQTVKATYRGAVLPSSDHVVQYCEVMR